MKRMMLLVALVMMTFVSNYAQEPSQVEKMVDEIVKKYENTNGVNCFKVAKGSGLKMFKMLFNKQLGRDFMRGVTSITVIDYGEASEETIQALRKEFDVFTSLLEEFSFDEKKGEVADSDYKRCFAAISEEKSSVSDFVIALESDGTKTFMYMAGHIVVE